MGSRFRAVRSDGKSFRPGPKVVLVRSEVMESGDPAVRRDGKKRRRCVRRGDTRWRLPLDTRVAASPSRCSTGPRTEPPTGGAPGAGTRSHNGLARGRGSRCRTRPHDERAHRRGSRCKARPPRRASHARRSPATFRSHIGIRRNTRHADTPTRRQTSQLTSFAARPRRWPGRGARA
jgi:hypothetical protein